MTSQRNPNAPSSSGEDHQTLDRRLERAARSVLTQLDPDDASRVRADFASVDDLVGAMVALARTVLRGGEVQPGHEELLLVSTLTRRNGYTGLQDNAENARQWYVSYLRVPRLATPVALRVGKTEPPELLTALDTAYRLTTSLEANRAEPPLYLAIVAAAVSCLAPADPAATAAAVLDRGAELAAAYEASGRTVDEKFPVMGDAHFLVEVAGYARAVRERRGATGDPLDDLAAQLPTLAQRLRDAAVRPWRLPGVPRVDDGPNTVAFLDAAARIVGGDADDGPVTSVVLFQRLVYGLRHATRDQHKKTDLMDASALGERVGTGLDVPHAHGDGVDRLEVSGAVAERVGAFFLDGVDAQGQHLLARWLTGGLRPEESLRDLLVPLARTRAVMDALSARAAAPEFVDPDGRATVAVVDALRKKIYSALTLYPEGLDARELVAGALPALWESRPRVIRALRRLIPIEEGWGPGGRRRNDPLPAVLAAWAVRGPLQEVASSSAPCHDANGVCATVQTPVYDAPPRCEERLGWDEPAASVVCPARPWAEPGWVDSDATIGDLVGKGQRTAHRQVEEYREKGGMWLAAVLPGRTPPAGDPGLLASAPA